MRHERSAYIGCGYSLAAILLLMLMVLLASCRTVKYVPVVEHRTDSLYITQHHRDSIYLHDSISVKEKGDTVRIERWRTKYVSKEVHDTTYIASHDTIPQPYPVTVEVPAKLNWWQRFRIGFGDLVLILAALWMGIKLLKKNIISHD